MMSVYLLNELLMLDRYNAKLFFKGIALVLELNSLGMLSINWFFINSFYSFLISEDIPLLKLLPVT